MAAPGETSASHPSPEQLAAFDRGQLTGPESSQVEQHVAACAACCALLENLPADSLLPLLRDAQPTPAPGGNESVAEPVPIADVPAALANHPRYRILERLG